MLFILCWGSKGLVCPREALYYLNHILLSHTVSFMSTHIRNLKVFPFWFLSILCVCMPMCVCVVWVCVWYGYVCGVCRNAFSGVHASVSRKAQKDFWCSALSLFLISLRLFLCDIWSCRPENKSQRFICICSIYMISLHSVSFVFVLVDIFLSVLRL